VAGADTTSAKSLRRLTAWALGPCLPAWMVLAALYLLDRLDGGTVLAAGLAVFVLMAGLVFTRLADFERLIRYAETLFENPDTPPPPLYTSATAQRLLTALTALRKLWADRRDEAASLARSRQARLQVLYSRRTPPPLRRCPLQPGPAETFAGS